SWSGRSAGGDNLADVLQQKRLAARYEDFFDAKVASFASDPLYAREPEFPARRGGRRPHAAVVATQVAVEIGVEPEPRTDWPVVSSGYRNCAASEDPTRTAIFNCRFEQGIAGEPAPSF